MLIADIINTNWGDPRIIYFQKLVDIDQMVQIWSDSPSEHS